MRFPAQNELVEAPNEEKFFRFLVPPLPASVSVPPPQTVQFHSCDCTARGSMRMNRRRRRRGLTNESEQYYIVKAVK